MTPAIANSTSFSQRLREETDSDHRAAESVSFVAELLKGSVPLPVYASYLAQYVHVYAAIETLAQKFQTDERVTPLLDPRLERLNSLQLDIADLNRRLTEDEAAEAIIPCPAVHPYVNRINATDGNPVQFLAHHYIRYVGDLAGGRVISRAVAKAYGLSSEFGGRFGHFPEISDPHAYLGTYRNKLDALELNETEQDSFIDEVRDAYGYSADIFSTLAARLQ